MKIFAIALIATLIAPGAWAAELDLGIAHPGMSLDEFRSVTWPAGTSVHCSNDGEPLPGSAAVPLTVPAPVARLGGTRCGLFNQDGSGWHPAAIPIAGTGSEVWGKFFPDSHGTPRLVQFLIKQPAEAFNQLADHFSELFGDPEMREDGLARWQSDNAEATIIDDGGHSLLAFIIDTRRQAALNARISHQPRHPAKEHHK